MSQPWLTSLMSQHGGSTLEKPLLARRRLYSIQGFSLVGPVGRGETIRNLPPELGDMLMGTEQGWVLCEAHSHIHNMILGLCILPYWKHTQVQMVRLGFLTPTWYLSLYLCDSIIFGFYQIQGICKVPQIKPGTPGSSFPVCDMLHRHNK